MPRFGKDKDTSRKEELDRQAAEEVARLTRRGGPPGMGGGMPGMGGAPMMPPSPLEQMAAEVREAPRPSQRRQQPARKAAPQPQQAFTPMPSGGVGSSFGPGGLNPGPRMGGAAPPPPAFGGGAYDEGPASGPPAWDAEPDEDEEMSITEMALIDHAARTGHRPEDLVMQYDASNAEEMREEAMRKFYERQQARRPGASTNNPFAPAGMRGGSSPGPARRRNEDPAAAGGALAQRLANKRRREEEEARRASAPAASAAAKADDDGALARVLARRRQALNMNEPAEAPEAEPQESVAPGRRHASSREQSSPGLRSVPLQPVADESAPSLEDMAASTPSRRPAARTAKKAGAATKAAAKAAPTKKAAKAPATKAAPATKKAAPAKAPAKVAKAPKAAKAAKTTRSTKGSTLAEAPATKRAPVAKKAPAAKKAGKAKTLFCIECGEKNPAIAKFCFNCGTRLAAPDS